VITKKNINDIKDTRVMRWVDYKTDQMVRSKMTFSVCKTHKKTKAKLPSRLKKLAYASL